jgi:DNA-binding GntR family transcriptional regulator
VPPVGAFDRQRRRQRAVARPECRFDQRDVDDVALGMARAYAARAIPEYFELNRLIHEAIMRASGNATLAGVYSTLSGRIQRARFAAHKTAGQWEEAMRDHNAMVELLRARDGEALGKLLRAHVLSKKAVIIATFGSEA